MNGVLRSLAVVAAGSGLVLGATQLQAPLNLTHEVGPAGQGQESKAHEAPVTKAQPIWLR